MTRTAHIGFAKEIVQAPLDQAARCLDLWLEEEGLCMTLSLKRRTAALLAQYFRVTATGAGTTVAEDGVILSFLRHYVGKKDIDMDNAYVLRAELKNALDRAMPLQGAAFPAVNDAAFSWKSAFLAVTLLTVSLAGWRLTHMKITGPQQAALREKVAAIALAEPGLAHASVWAQVKGGLGVRRYQDISFWDYGEAVAIVDQVSAGTATGEDSRPAAGM